MFSGGKDSLDETTRPSQDTFAGYRADSHMYSPVFTPPQPKRRQEEPEYLNSDTLQALFSGAPEFSISASKQGPKPLVTYRGAATSNVQDASDYLQLSHPAFAAATLGRHQTTDLEGSPHLDSLARARHEVALDLLEVPNMLSIHGLEPGTVGFEHFLQLAIADSKLSEDEHDILSNRRLLSSEPEKLGLRPVDLERLIDRLTELGDMQQALKRGDYVKSVVNEQKAAEMYTDLFAKLLVPPRFQTSSEQDPTGLKVQIEALIKLLNLPGLWHDFTYVEWRIRVGQLLWAPEEKFSPNEDEAISERDVLLLQVTLASELLTRLEAAGVLAQTPTDGSFLNSKEAEDVAKMRTTKIEWDLVLAKQFLDNVSIRPKLPANDKDQNRSSVFSALSFFTANETLDDPGNNVEPIVFPRDDKSQLSGLLHFASVLGWPHATDIKQELDHRRPKSSVAGFATPVSTPGTLGTNRNSYFGDLMKRPQLGRVSTAQSIQLLPHAHSADGADFADAGGWLSRSWLTGLVLPGEAACHFLISTLLENSPQAIEALGDCANLYGGFFYHGRSYWSKSCVVGRVLAASIGANDCMGWISIPGPVGAGNTGAEQPDGWVNLDIKDLPASAPRILQTDVVAADSNPLRNADPATLKADAFTYPSDGPPVLGNDALYEGLSFNSSSTFELGKDDSGAGISATATQIASLTFSSPTNPKSRRKVLPLTHDVQFVAAYPCFPQPRSASASSRSGPEDVEGVHTGAGAEKELPAAPCHPLHAGYTYTILPAASLLFSGGGNEEFNKNSADEVVVLDCRGSSTADLQLSARAWCASAGANAVVGRAGRTCLGCCVREAKAVGVGVVIRV